jgi:hypothetical protein
LGLLLHLAEHNADPACAQELPDELRDAEIPEGEAPDQLLSDVFQLATNASDASDDVHPDAMADEILAVHPDAGVEKSADPVLVAQEQDASWLPVEAAEQAALSVLYKPDAALFVER